MFVFEKYKKKKQIFILTKSLNNQFQNTKTVVCKHKIVPYDQYQPNNAPSRVHSSDSFDPRPPRDRERSVRPTTDLESSNIRMLQIWKVLNVWTYWYAVIWPFNVLIMNQWSTLFQPQKKNVNFTFFVLKSLK